MFSVEIVPLRDDFLPDCEWHFSTHFAYYAYFAVISLSLGLQRCRAVILTYSWLEISKPSGDDFKLMRDWLVLAVSPSVVKRSIKYSLIVGFVLTLINHSDAILSGTVTLSRFVRIVLTFLVPYTVSTLSSVGALLEQRRAAASLKNEQQEREDTNFTN